MGRCSIQLVVGPAGSGKSTYCHTMQEHADNLAGTIQRRRLHVLNLDPAAEVFRYRCSLDVRELISVSEVMQELGLGPNGALVYSMEYVLEHVHDWLLDALEDFDDDETVLLDCPGQVELYTHVPIMKSIVETLKLSGYDGHLVTVFCVDASFLTADVTKFLSGSLLALSAMIALELPHVNVLTKADLLPRHEIESILSQSARELVSGQRQDYYYDDEDDDHNNKDYEQQSSNDYYHGYNVTNNLEYPNNAPSSSPFHVEDVLEGEEDNEQRSNNNDNEEQQVQQQQSSSQRRRNRREGLTNALCQLLEDYSMVSFLPLNIRDEDSIQHVLATVDHAIQFGEDLEVRAADGDDAIEEDEEENDDGDND
ncbi:hypothetical protein ACA910_010262 [Epithemia clementina (nom. ined.)]